MLLKKLITFSLTMIYFLVQVSLIGLSKMDKLKKQDKIKKMAMREFQNCQDPVL